ncbi:tRNA (N(6)-L-threonylcarbamoyladenosine(37)-C(2))-methylthiotransferase MtaB [Helicobacter mustelae]|uniref:Putative MiaB-like tRNA modifying enzyme n=1 Tax=Helicobacter mustelae (strain ATCC 43772 / CCUG 25715 / CIP 103759 / LMG 18044 / NCTC 12198 / R85-136P) TaxID=679897 RepID=D3UH00_HELM1|nr:tRNA (N(6)-L-threonylcarbamoyladenosine(37)-C(2))-methylthiotransferase MtaB [Helicobacter mustelae]CBG39772.1 Putative MiaB-like tRNA modifying enzyme [Helicobacter mustelae 12198]SQH71281.1 MiaB-like tRNA modifying enzyme [Helicobacter mustelae]STP12406.1 MiaB-like tRNA modifying enzyme [Helicobacter mustelae]
MKVFFKTFGCRTNLFDTQVMRQNLKDFVVCENEEEADIIVVNSCTVTNGADAGVRSYVNKMNRSGKKIYFTGCGAKTQGKNLFDKNLVFGSFGHTHKEKINDFLLAKGRFFYEERSDASHIDTTLVSEFVGKVRAFIKIQEGCDFACSYCIIPSVRGISRSYPQARVLEQIGILADHGVSEVVLTGTNVGSYGKDFGSNIAKLIHEISKIKGILRIRIGSLEPSQIDEEFLELLEGDFLERHLHIALQHSSDRMLEIMNRHNRVASDRALLEKIADRGFAIGTDFIVGHPGESVQVWEEALENLTQLPLTHIHPFIYSIRDNTPSAKMKNTIRGDVAKERLHIINALVAEKNFSFRQKMSPLRVLVESGKDGLYSGLDQFFNRISIKSAKDLKNCWVDVEDYGIEKRGNYAEI